MNDGDESEAAKLVGMKNGKAAFNQAALFLRLVLGQFFQNFN
jgi:hypothetical protein